MSSLRSRVYFEKSKILRAQDQHVQALQVIGRVLGILRHFPMSDFPNVQFPKRQPFQRLG